MDSEKATAVSPGSSLSAPRRSVLDWLPRAAMTPAEDDQIPQERETAETDQFSLLAPRRVVCVRACGHCHR